MVILLLDSSAGRAKVTSMNSANMAEYMRQRRIDRKAKALEILGGQCIVCGTSENLEFDHIDPKTKLDAISSPRLLDGLRSIFFAEVAKCQLLCKLHHTEKSVANKELSREYPDPFCGGGAMYGLGCRCDKCSHWKKLYRAKLVRYDGSSC